MNLKPPDSFKCSEHNESQQNLHFTPTIELYITNKNLQAPVVTSAKDEKLPIFLITLTPNFP